MDKIEELLTRGVANIIPTPLLTNCVKYVSIFILKSPATPQGLRRIFLIKEDSALK